MVPSESSARSIKIDQVVASWDLDSEMALIEIGADSGLRTIRRLGDSRFCECTSLLSNCTSLARELSYEFAKTYVSPHFGTER